jgi:excisionase family DNA binding protein
LFVSVAGHGLKQSPFSNGGLGLEKSRRESVQWFMAPDMDVMINLRDCCDALGLDLRSVQVASCRLSAARPSVDIERFLEQHRGRLNPWQRAGFSVSPKKGKKGGGQQRGRKPPPAAVDESAVMTLREVADYLDCSYDTAYRLASRGDIPSFRVGGRWRSLKSHIDQWIAKGGGAPRHYRRKSKTANKPPSSRADAPAPQRALPHRNARKSR